MKSGFDSWVRQSGAFCIGFACVCGGFLRVVLFSLTNQKAVWFIGDTQSVLCVFLCLCVTDMCSVHVFGVSHHGLKN